MQFQPRRTRSAPPETLESCIKRLKTLSPSPSSNSRPAAAAASPFKPVSDRANAAVVAVLFDAADDPTPRCLVTRRAGQLRAHSGEVALPGGRRDDEDSVVASKATGSRALSVDAVTALREAQEEVGLAASDVDVVAELPRMLSKHLLSVAVVVATLKKQPKSVRSFLDSLRPSAEEVDAAFEVPLDHFLEPQSSLLLSSSKSKTPTTTTTTTMPPPTTTTTTTTTAAATTTTYRYRDARFGRVATAPRFRLHFFEMKNRPCVFSDPKDAKRKEDEFLVWGLTALILIGVAEAALGRPASFDVSPPRAAPYREICCFRDRNGGEPTTFGREKKEEEAKPEGTKRKR